MTNKKFYEYQNSYLKFASDVHKEVGRARGKFPKGDRLLGALMEETGELAQALLKIKESGESPQKVYDEAVQVAAMAFRLANEGEPDYGYEGTKCHYLGCPWPAIDGQCALCYQQIHPTTED